MALRKLNLNEEDTFPNINSDIFTGMGGPTPQTPQSNIPRNDSVNQNPEPDYYQNFDDGNPNQVYDRQQQQQQQYEPQDEHNGQDGNSGGGVQFSEEVNFRSAFGAKVVGLLVIALVLIVGVKVWRNGINSKNKRIEQLVRKNPTGNISSYDEQVFNLDDDNNTVDISSDGWVTEIMSYEKGESENGQTLLHLSSDLYGQYTIFIPYYQHSELKSKGYILVDLEIVSNKVTFLFISSKQDEMDKLMNK